MNKNMRENLCKIINEYIIPLRPNSTPQQKESIHAAILKVCTGTSKYNSRGDLNIKCLNEDKMIWSKDQEILLKVSHLLGELSPEAQNNIGFLATNLPLHLECLNKISCNISRLQKQELISSWLNTTSALSADFAEEFSEALNNIDYEATPFYDISMRGCISYCSHKARSTGADRCDREISFAYHLRLTIEKWIAPSQDDFTSYEGEQLSHDRFMHYSAIKKIGYEILGFDADYNYRERLYRLRKNYPSAHFVPYRVKNQ